MKLLKISSFVLAAALLPLTACNDKEASGTPDLSMGEEAVAFGLDGGSMTVTVSTDENWSSTYPEWVTVTPDNGKAGKFEIVVSVDGNYTDSNPDIPRYGNIVITEASGGQITISVSQDGCWETTIADLANWDDGTLIHLSRLTVVCPFPNGFIALGEMSQEDDTIGLSTDSRNLWVLSSESVSVGDELSVYGKKFSFNSLPVIIMDSYSLLSSGNEVGETGPTDITGQVDSYAFSQWEYVSVKGIIGDDGSVTFIDDDATVVISNIEDGLELKTSYYATITGYYAGTSSNNVALYVTDIEYVGVVDTRVIFEEDFSWLEKFADVIAETEEIDAVAQRTNSNHCRMDQHKRDDDISLIAYFCDSLCYTIYTYTKSTNSEGTEVKSKNLHGFTTFYAYPSDSGGYYISCGMWNTRGLIVISSMPEEVRSDKMLSLRLTFDVAYRAAVRGGWRVEILPAGDLDESTVSQGTWSYGPTILSEEAYIWNTISINLSNVDFSEGQVIGIGSYDWDSLTNATESEEAKIYLDNIKLTWTGAVSD